LFTINLKKNIRIGSAKEQILAEYKRLNNIELPYERCRFMEIQNGKLLNNIPPDEQCLLLISDEICIQDKEETLDELQSKVYLRRWNRSEMQLESVQIIIVNNHDYNDQLKNKVN
jgi:hypothetical protein